MVRFHVNGKKVISFPFIKIDKQNLIKYRPVSLLPICGKIFERPIFKEMFRFFLENKLIAPPQSGFKPGHSGINQPLSITHKICNFFDDGLKVRSVFLDISKAFDKVWHDGVIFKLERNGISGDLLNIIIDISDLSDNLSPNVKLFAYDTSLFSVTNEVNVSAKELKMIIEKSAIGLFNGK